MLIDKENKKKFLGEKRDIYFKQYYFQEYFILSPHTGVRNSESSRIHPLLDFHCAT